MMKLAAPFGVFVLMSVFLVGGLGRDPRILPSPLIDKPAPDFRLALLREPRRTFSPAQLRGRVWMLNVWASWCVSCRAEHDVLAALSRHDAVPVYGLDYKDERSAALSFLERHGDPYATVIEDPDGSVGIDYGVYGVPETYLVDAGGVIRYKQIGALTPDIVQQTILPLVRRLTP